MREQANNFPPNNIADLDIKSASNFVLLLRQIREFPVTIILGSGVSASVGLPIWNELLRRICSVFFYHWEWEISSDNKITFENPPKNMSIAFVEDFLWSDKAIVRGKEFSKGNPILVAQQIKNCIRDIDWRYLLNKALYGTDTELKRSHLMESLGLLCAQHDVISSIVNYNYDSLFESYLIENDLRFSVLWDNKSKCKKNTLTIYHPHGYLKLGGGPSTSIILAENEYHKESSEPYSWANLIQTKLLCNSTCIFIGVSMTDPNLRRLLHATHGVFQGKHFAFLSKDSSKKESKKMYESLFDRDIANLGVMTIRYPLKRSSSNPYKRLPELIELIGKCTTDKNALWSMNE